MRAFIYTLSDPRTNEIRYVGKTCDLKRRYWDHIGSRYNNHTGHWLRSLRKLGLRPAMEVLEEFPNHESDWQESERFHISYFRFLGMRLTNQESGGETGKLHSKETKQVMSLKAKGRSFSALAKQRYREWRNSSESKTAMIAMAESKRGKKRSIEAIEKHRAKMLGHTVSQETRDKLRRSATAQRARELASGVTHGPETREKLRQLALARTRSPTGAFC